MRRRLSVAAALALSLCAVAAPAFSVAARATPAPVRTLVRTRSPIVAFGQGGGKLAWIEDANPERVCGVLHVLVTATHRESRLALDSRDSCNGGIQYFAFGGERAIWDSSGCENSVCNDSLESAGFGDRRVKSVAGLQADLNDVGGTRVGGTAAAGSTVLYWTEAFQEFIPEPCQENCGALLRGGVVARIAGRSSVVLSGVPTSSLLAVAGNRLAVVPFSRRGCSCSGHPAWSPDGRSVAFATLHEAPGYELAVVPAGGGEARTVVEHASWASAPVWSPDGRSVAYGADGAIYVVHADGRNVPTRVAAGSDPAWSPDGTRIAFAAGDAISVVARTGGIARPVAHDQDPSAPIWSPDGTRIAFVGGAGIRIANADGTGAHMVAVGRAPSWSPDGRRIAYTSAAPAKVRVVDADGTGDHELADGTEPSWSPDGATIAYSDNGEISVIGADGGVPRQLTSNHVYDYAPTWSPDGTRLLFMRESPVGTYGDPAGYTREVYVMNADGGAQRQLTRLPATLDPVTVEIRTLAGRLVRQLAPGGQVAALALSTEIVAVLVRQTRTAAQLRVYDARSGALQAAVSVPGTTSQLSASGRDVVFSAGTTISLFDSALPRPTALATAGSTPLGLSIEGRSVAWAENTGARHMIRALPVSVP
jgi:Tol biopolymer transport system component